MEYRPKNVVMPILGVNIAMFVLQLMLGEGFTRSLMLVSSDAWARPWIFVTSMFLHGSGSHLLFNMYVLMIFGPLIEHRIGPKRFLGIYFISGILASIASTLFYSASLGASGAIMGMMGVTIMLMPDLRVLFFFVIPMSLRTAGIVIALIDLVGVFNPGGNIANVAHLTGLGAGLVYGAYLIRAKKRYHKHAARVIKIKKAKTIGKESNHIHMSDDEIDSYMKYGRL